MCIIIIINNNNNNNKNNNENTITKAKICHSFNYFHLINLCFYLNKWHYKEFLIQLLRLLSLQKLNFVHPKWFENKQNLVKSYSLTSNWITKKKEFFLFSLGIGIPKYLNMYKSQNKVVKKRNKCEVTVKSTITKRTIRGEKMVETIII